MSGEMSAVSAGMSFLAVRGAQGGEGSPEEPADPLVLSWCPFPGCWQVFSSATVSFFESGSAVCGTVKERST